MTDALSSIIELFAPDAVAREAGTAKLFFLIPSLEAAKLAESVLQAAQIEAKLYAEADGSGRLYVTLPAEHEEALLGRAEAYARLALKAHDFAAVTLRPMLQEETVKPSVAFKAWPNGSISIGIDLTLPFKETAAEKPAARPPVAAAAPKRRVSRPVAQEEAKDMEEDIDLDRSTSLGRGQGHKNKHKGGTHMDENVKAAASFASSHMYPAGVGILTFFVMILLLVTARGAMCPDFGHKGGDRPWYCGSSR